MNDTTDIPVIAIDGPSGSGKGMVTHALARGLGFHILDSGALYRLIGLAAIKSGTDPADEPALAWLGLEMDVRFEPTDDAEEPLRVFLEGEDVTVRIRTDEAGVYASRIAPLPQVRESIRVLQHSFRCAPGLVADGRDMGTDVFVGAPLKIYLTASVEARAERRYNQLKDKDIGVSLAALSQSIAERDERDMNRAVAPLRPADDAIVIDSTSISREEVLERAFALVQEHLGLTVTRDATT
ncbi:MAG: cytidylate kinase [Gammaproteobacteria bacterium]|nr:cytidylate kinase [Gammaproteobacteria bacterium]|tara:strand:+ start:543 stop:1262 length:720 start_codon:yes stop_codon:yes gene_type:complete